MPQQYFAACPSCGKRYAVQLTDAGTQRACSACPATFMVPNSLKLKELSGDPYPSLRPVEKVQQALADRAPPFDGVCQGCGSVPAEYHIPVALHVMEERSMADDGGIRITPLGVSLAVSKSIEQWSTTWFPLLLCFECERRFQGDRNWIWKSRILWSLLWVGVFASIVWLFHLEQQVSRIAGIVAICAWTPVLLFLPYASRRARTYAQAWLSRVPYVADAIAAEEEYQLRIGTPARISGDTQ